MRFISTFDEKLLIWIGLNTFCVMDLATDL